MLQHQSLGYTGGPNSQPGFKLQEVQKLLAVSASPIVQAFLELTKQLVPSKQPTVDSFDVKVPLYQIESNH